MIAVMVPSRGRPQNIQRLADAWKETTTGSADLIVYVDDDDPELGGYLALEDVDIHVGPRRRLGPTLNDAAPGLADKYDVVGFMGDDHLPRTHGWDATILATVKANPMSVVYGNDVIRGEGLASAAFLDAEIVRRLGYFVPKGAIHLYLDDFWMAVGRGLGKLIYLDHVIIEHLHPISGKVEWDEGYKEVNNGEMYDHDRVVFEQWMSEASAQELEKLRG